jgi:hypothetical protein
VVKQSALETEQEQPGSGLRARAPMSFALREGGLEHKLIKSPTVLGRGSGADIVLSGPLVSRRHAQLSDTDHGLMVSDLGSRLAIGDNSFVLVELLAPVDRQATWSDVRAPRESERLATSAYTSDEASVATRRADALQLLGGVVDKALALGRGSEAEHLIGTHLVAALSDATAGRGVAPEVARSAAQYAVKLATATGKATWLDFAFRLYNALGQTIPLPIVDEMYTVLRRVRGLDRELLRSYTDYLRAHEDRLSAPERFVLQRLAGLDRLAAWHPAG